MTASIFERELKKILNGDKEMLEKVTKTCDYEERAGYYKITDKPFIVIRAAGSFGVDLVAVRHDVSFPIEVKASSKETIRFSESSGRGTAQAKELIGECRKAKLFPIYAYRLKGVRGDAWKIFTVEMEDVEGRLRIVYDRLPKLKESDKGHLILRWKEGMPLHKFIDYLCS